MKEKLDNNWTISTDAGAWKLEFTEVREVVNKKTKKTTRKPMTDTWWFPTTKQWIEKYKEESLKKCKSLDELSEKLDHLSNVIERIAKTSIKYPKQLEQC